MGSLLFLLTWRQTATTVVVVVIVVDKGEILQAGGHRLNTVQPSALGGERWRAEVGGGGWGRGRGAGIQINEQLIRAGGQLSLVTQGIASRRRRANQQCPPQ